MMSDIPWALAWYGDHQCVWLTQNAQSDFFAIHDFLKPVRALHFSPQTMDNRFLSQWVRAGANSWGSFVLNGVMRGRFAETFPLRYAAPGFSPEQVFLTDWERWKSAPAGPIAPVSEDDGEPDKATPISQDAEKK